MASQMKQAAGPVLLGILALVGTGVGRAAAVVALAATGHAGTAALGRLAALADAEAQASVPSSISQIAQTIDERLERDSKVVDQVARHLHGLRNGTDKIAEDVLGKVYDMHSLDGFLAEHNVALDEHAQLGREVDRLTSLADSLSRELQMVRNMTLHQETNAAQLDANSSKTKASQRLVESSIELEQSNTLLQQENDQASSVLTDVGKEVEALRASISAQRGIAKDLEAEILQQHQYAELCNKQAGHYETQLAHYEGLLDAVRSRGGRVMKVAEMTTKVHGIIQEKNAALKARIDKAVTNIGTIQTQTLTTRAEQEQLQKQAQAELAKLGEELGQHRTKVEEAKAQLKYLELEQKAEQKKFEAAKERMAVLQKALLSGKMARLQSNNTQLKAELQQAQETMQASQAASVKYEAEILQANQTLSSLKLAAEDSLQQAEQEAQDALARIVAARQKGEQAVAKAKEATMEAESAALKDCNTTWDERNAGLLEELQKCEPLELELKTVRAQVEALTNTISASEAEEAVQS